ncbi:MAG: hypothetical protein PHH26_09375 [Candidatus Thermoplasmatota archaeon]|nr:hypothetical protein [Candidatus Thermoplasmatota archaeon]
MKAKYILASIALALAAFFGIGILVTELLQEKIYFSLFFGIPAGLVAGIVVLIIALVGFGKKEKR